MEADKCNMIFTACTGRCGQNSLSKYFNIFGKACFAEVEPPDLIYKNHWPFGNHIRTIQRKWIVTHEDLGRGKALLWYDNDDNKKMFSLVKKRVHRVERIKKRKKADTYIELSKFFIRSYCDETFKQLPEMGVLLLRRNPITNARSFSNRSKDFALDGVMPYFKKTCFPIDVNMLSTFQLYLWQWVEIELRYQRFVEQTNIKKHKIFFTEDLNDPEKVRKLFKYFDIQEIKPIVPLKPVNTNISQGKKATVITRKDKEQFIRFIDMIPPNILDKVFYIKDFLTDLD